MDDDMDDDMDVDVPFASQYSRPRDSGDRVIWKPSQTKSAALRALQADAARSAQQVPRVTSTVTDYASIDISTNLAKPSASHTVPAVSHHRHRKSSRGRQSFPSASGSATPTASDSSLRLDISDLVPLIAKASAQIDQNALQKKRHLELTLKKQRAAKGESSVAFVTSAPRTRQVASVRSRSKSNPSAALPRPRSSASMKRADSPDSPPDQSMHDADMDILSYVSSNVHEFVSAGPSRPSPAPSHADRRHSVSVGTSLMPPPPMPEVSANQSSERHVQRAREVTPSAIAHSKPARAPITPPADLPPARAKPVPAILPRPVPKPSPAHTPEPVTQKPTQPKPVPRALGMRRAPYSGSSSQFSPSQTLPTKQRGFKPPLLRPRSEYPPSPALLTPSSTPSPVPRADREKAASHPVRNREERKPSPPPADADSSFGDISLEIDADALEDVLRQYD
ncbi:hypothetical protein B0H21DRAFT_519087 [Amylocystis lapponica]|nr:hypothetical protein B0H21DRAFT_519087 [Amylocystis lapponica]